MKWVLALTGVLIAGCSSSVDVREMNVSKAPSASPAKVTIEVDKSRHSDAAEALENGLNREFQKIGYEVVAGNLVLRAEIIALHRGSTFWNVAVGMGAGADFADARVRVSDGTGNVLMSFVIRGTVEDKRYRELDEVLDKFVAKRIAKEIKKASQ